MTTSRALPHDIETALAQWAESVRCRLLILFGSAAAGRAGPKSDLDLALDFPTLPAAERRLQIIGEIQDLCAGRTVDAVFLRPEISPTLRYEVFRWGYPIYEAHPGLFVSETVRALALYEDALPFRRLLRRRTAVNAEHPEST